MDRPVRAMCQGMATVAAVVTALGAGALNPTRAQEPALTVAVASAGPRFLAMAEGPSKTRAERWRDVSNAAVFQQRISLDFNDVTLGQALTAIARKAGLRLTYSPAVVRLGTRVTLNASDLTVGAALSAVLYDAGVDVLLTGSGQAALVKRVALQRQAGTIVGRVTDAASGEGIAEADVRVENTRLEAVTGPDGQYRIARVPAGLQTVTARRIGYTRLSQPVTVTEEETTLDFALRATALNLGEIVVTGTAGNLERRAQPAVVASIDAADVVDKAPVANVAELLQGRVPGVSVTQSSGSSGLTQRINIRGGASISLSNEPLVFIDGVRMDSRNRDLNLFTSGSSSGSTTSSALNDVKPEEIESIEIVKGPAAATLYGADASAGVIQIITKKGGGGGRRFSQSVSLSYENITPHFTPLANFAACPVELIGADSPNPLCRGQTEGAVVSDNPLVREGAFRDGQLVSFQYAGQGGGDAYGYYVSYGYDEEDGTLPGNDLNRHAGRVNFNWTPHSKLRLDVNLGLNRVVNHLPQAEDGLFSYMLQGGFGSPLNVNADGSGGWFFGNYDVESAGQIETKITTLRYTPSVQANYTPFPWFTHRLTLGADVPRAAGFQLFPKNDQGWYVGEFADGYVQETRDNHDTYTLDYLGNLRAAFGSGDRFTSDLSFGLQYIDEQSDFLSTTGIGLTTTAAHVVSAAAEISAFQGSSRQKSLGYLMQEQLGYRDRLFLQLGARIDRNSSFGSQSESFFLPKAGVSYVISEEPFWRGLAPVFSTLRLRAAYGTTGRAPTPGASLQTYLSQPYVTPDGSVFAGVVPFNPGNANLKAERGKELEAGLDASLFGDRVGLEVTYFNKKTTDLLLRRPTAPSLGFSQGEESNPFVNIGEVVNRGVEVAVRGTPVNGRNLTWDLRLSGSTLHNEVLSLGDVEPFGRFEIGRFTVGQQLGAVYTHRIRSVDLENGVVMVSDAPEFFGNQIPTFEASAGTTLTLFRRLRLYAQFDGKSGFRVRNLTEFFRDRLLANSERAVKPADQGGFTEEELLRRYGPYIAETTGEEISFDQVNEDYFQQGDYIRFRELSLTFFLPSQFARRFGASDASLTLAGRNLGLWTKYRGADPEVLARLTRAGEAQFLRGDLFTVPQAQSWAVRLNLQF